MERNTNPRRETMKTLTYRGCILTETETTTDFIRYTGFGRRYTATARVWGVSGRVQKNACASPLLTSAASAREYVREELELRGE
jgi:hypothetical protein